MYILRVIPLKRRIPQGELTYISKSNIPVGSVIEIPLKKSAETAIVIKENEVSKEKEYIKSINFKLTTLNTVNVLGVVNKKVLKTILFFSNYSLCEVDTIIRALLGKIDFKNPEEKNSEIIIASKESKTDKNIISIHKFLNNFISEKNQIKKINLHNHKALSLYGKNYLGFDPALFIIALANELNIEVYLNNSANTLAFEEWNIKEKKSKENLGEFSIFIRDNDDHLDKSNPLSKEMLRILTESLKNGQRALIISNTRNFAPRTICHDCSTVHNCTKCSNPMVLVKNNRNYAKKYGIAGEYIYICTTCSIAENSIVKCRNCDSWNLLPLGYGTERIIEQLKNNYPNKIKSQIYDMTDRISVRDLKKWNESGGIIITKPNYIYEIEQPNIVLVPSISPILYSKKFESGESARNLIHELRSISSHVYLSVMNEHEDDFLKTDYKIWRKNEIIDRKTFSYPPYGRHLRIELDAYASKSNSLIDGIMSNLKNLAIPETISKEKDQFLNIIIEASFDNEKWSIDKKATEIPEKIKQRLYPFLKHLKIQVS